MQTLALSGITMESILAYVPEQPFLAVLAMLALFTVKGVSLVIPLNLLYAVNGVLFNPVIAYLVDIVGTTISFSVPYLIGRKLGKSFQQKLINKYPKLVEFNRIRSNNDFSFCALIRMIGIAPSDIVSMLLGSMDIKYLPYITGCIFGFIPHMLAFTTLGASAAEANWTLFFAALIFELLILGIAVIIKRRRQKAISSEEE